MNKILVIEDTEAVREEIVAILGYEGFEVGSAENGRVALDSMAQSRPDLVVSDLMMPVMDGYAVLAALRASPETATIPFICVTARAERVDMRQAMELGADDYLTKPFTAEELITACKAALAKGSRAGQDTETKLEALRGSIAWTLPHELRTPLTCIVGYAEMLNDGNNNPSPGEVSAMGGRILGAALRLSRLTENFLLYVQLQFIGNDPEGLRELGAKAGAELESLVTCVVSRKAKEMGREDDVSVRVTAGMVPIMEEHLRKIVQELIENALKFSDSGTPVLVMAERTGGQTIMRITDHGRGMSQEEVESLAPYRQLNRDVHEQQGMGLGLPIARQMMQLCGGELTIESALGHGTTVSITFPGAVTLARSATTAVQ